MTKDQLNALENLRRENIWRSAELLKVYCYHDNSIYTEEDAVYHLEKIIREMKPGESTNNYPVLNDVIYYGVLIRVSMFMLRMGIEKFPNTQFAKDCKWCIDKRKQIRDEIRKRNLKLFRIYWPDEVVEDLYGSSISDALYRYGHDPDELEEAERYEEVNDDELYDGIYLEDSEDDET